MYGTVGGQSRIFNFRTNAFVNLPLPGGANPLGSGDFYRIFAFAPNIVLPGGSTAPPAAASASFSIPLPSGLSAGIYRLSVAGIDRSLRRTAITNRNFTIGGTTPPPATDTTDPTATINSVDGRATTSTSPVSITTMAPITGAAADVGTGVKEVRVFIVRNYSFSFSTFSASGEFWNGSTWVPRTISASNPPAPGSAGFPPSLLATLTPAAGGSSVTWTLPTGLPPVATGVQYRLAALATDKATPANSTSITTIATNFRAVVGASTSGS